MCFAQFGSLFSADLNNITFTAGEVRAAPNSPVLALGPPGITPTCWRRALPLLAPLEKTNTPGRRVPRQRCRDVLLAVRCYGRAIMICVRCNNGLILAVARVYLLWPRTD